MTVTIGALIERLQWDLKKHGDVKIICAKDSEGNGYNYLRGVDFVYAVEKDYEIEYIFDSEEEFLEENEDEEPQKFALFYV